MAGHAVCYLSPLRAVAVSLRGDARSETMDDAHIRLQIHDTPAGLSITVKRNCSISPQALAWLLALTAAFSFGIGIGFAVFGAWPVLPFVGLEVAALAAAFYVNGRHAADYERFALAAGA